MTVKNNPDRRIRTLIGSFSGLEFYDTDRRRTSKGNDLDVKAHFSRKQQKRSYNKLLIKLICSVFTGELLPLVLAQTSLRSVCTKDRGQ